MFSQTSNMKEGEQLYVDALIQFLDVFSQEFIGTTSINYAAVFNHVHSGQFHWVVGPSIKTIDDAMAKIEQAVINGAPIWNFLKFENERQRQVFEELEEAYDNECKRRDEEQRVKNLKIYKCLTCAHYEIKLQSGGEVKRRLPGMNVFTTRCKYLEMREPGCLSHKDDGYYRERDRRERIERGKMDYHPGAFSVYKDKNKKGCSGYVYDPDRDF
jgi:hypothetical protein